MAGSVLPPAGPNRDRGPSAITIHHATTGRPQSPHTRRAYAADWQAFAAWCIAAGHLASSAGRLGPNGLRRRLAAIADRHCRSGQPWDSAQPAIRATLRRLGRPGTARGDAGRDRALRALLASCGEDLARRRDRVLFYWLRPAGCAAPP